MSGAEWTTPADLRAQVERLWASGRLLSAMVTGEKLFPLTLKLRRPDSRTLSERFDEVRQWIRDLESGTGYQIEWSEIDHRVLGRNRVPARVLVPGEREAFEVIGRTADAGRFRDIIGVTRERLPILKDWLARKPLVALEQSREWNRILDVLLWFREHPRCGYYLRQLDIPGVHTKFIETRGALLSELLDLVLPAEEIEIAAEGPRNFERRYGLASKPLQVRFRILDPEFSICGLTDLSVPAGEFAGLRLPVKKAFVTENEINGLAFPPVRESIVIFGLGYGLQRLRGIDWLRPLALHYWGDIDTYGFHMLDRFRSAFPDAASFLMDPETLLRHRELWVREGSPYGGELTRLTAVERSLYDDLRFDRHGERIRLEQERIPYGWVKQALTASGL